jgi:hypothetical protein
MEQLPAALLVSQLIVLAAVCCLAMWRRTDRLAERRWRPG